MTGKTFFSRRGFLKGAGIVTVLVAGGGVWRAYNQGVFSTGEGPAYEPWRDWRATDEEGPLALVSAAILAANPHNSQPWLFQVTASRIDLFADTSRNIGAIDPYLREMHIGLGCALENLLLAAKARGYAYRLTLLPDDSDPTHVASIELWPEEASVSDLYKAIPHRHTNRGAYDRTRPVSAETLQALQALGKNIPEVSVFWFAKEAERRKVGDFIVEATEAIIADEEQATDSASWFRQRWQDVQRYRDGLTIDALGFPTLLRVAAKIFPVSRKRFDQGWLLTTRDNHVATAAAFGILAVPHSRDNAQRLQGGRLWQRMHLWGTTQGLAMHPLSQLTERADREMSLGIKPRFGPALQELIGDANGQALMLFRLGYPTMQALASPRRAVGDVLV